MKNIFLLLTAFFVTNAIQAQVKNIDLEIKIISSPEIIPCDGSNITIQYRIINHGPDDLNEETDSILFYGPHVGIDDEDIIHEIIYAGDSVTITQVLNSESIIFLIDPISDEGVPPPYITGKTYKLGYDVYPLSESGFHSDENNDNNASYKSIVWCNDGTSNIIDPKIQTSLRLYPNPASQVLNIELPIIQVSDIKIEIMDITGRVMKINEWSKVNTNNKNFEIDIHSLPSGLYYCKYTINNKVGFEKFVKK